MHKHIITTGLARRALLGATVATALTAAPAMAAAGPDGVRAGHNVTVFHNIDMVAAFGHGIGEQTRVDVERGGHLISSVQGAAVSTPEGGAVEVNHGPEGAPQPGDCFVGATPDILPGDRIRVSNPGGAAGVDDAIVDNITITDRVVVERAGDGGPVVTPGAPGNRQEVWVYGTAHYMNADGTLGDPIPTAALDSAELLGVPDDNQLRLAPKEVVVGDGEVFNGGAPLPAGSYIAKWYDSDPANPTQGIVGPDDRNRNGHTDQEIFDDFLVPGEGYGIGFGHTAVLPPVSMLVDGMGEQTTAAPGCEAAPKVPNSVGTTSVDTLNIQNTGVADTETVLSVGGFSAAGAVDPTVVLSDGTTSVPKPVTPSGTGTQQGFTAVFTRGDLNGLAEGDLTVQLQVGGVAAGAERTIAYDLVAPTFSVNLAEGTYTGPQKLIVTGGPVTYTLDGGPERAYAGVPIDLNVGSHTVVLKSTDSSGNTTTRTLKYVINPVPAQQQSNAAPPVTTFVAPLPLAANTNRAAGPAATMLRGTKRLSSANARRSGLVARFSAPQGSRRATIRVFRSRSGVLTLVGSKTVTVRRGGNSIKLNSKALKRKLSPGLYLIQVTLRNSAGRAGTPGASFVRISK